MGEAARLTNARSPAESISSADPGLRQLASLSIGRKQIQLWLVNLSAYPWVLREDCLSSIEQHRAGRLVFDKDRSRFRAAHCALRELLARRLDCPPSAPDFQTTTQGKPYLAALSSTTGACRFNLSHSEDLALVGMADDVEIGVDIETVRIIDDALSLAREVFTCREQAELRETPPNQRDSAFLRGWTRKEACLKAVGCGLGVSPRAFHVGLAGEQTPITLITDTGQSVVQVQSIDVGPGATAAVAMIQDNQS